VASSNTSTLACCREHGQFRCAGVGHGKSDAAFSHRGFVAASAAFDEVGYLCLRCGAFHALAIDSLARDAKAMFSANVVSVK